MIEIKIKTNGNNIFDSLKDKDCTLGEAALIVYRLEQIKQKLLNIGFDNKFLWEKK